MIAEPIICFVASSTTTVVTTAAALSLPPKIKKRIIGYKNKQGATVIISIPPKNISLAIKKIPKGMQAKPDH